MLEVIHRPKYRLTGKKLPQIKSKLIEKDKSGNAIYLGRKNKFLYVTTKDCRKWIIPIDRKEIRKQIEPWEDISLIRADYCVAHPDSVLLYYPRTLYVTSDWAIYRKTNNTIVGTLYITADIPYPLVLNEKAMLEAHGHTKIHDAYIVNPNDVFYERIKINTKKEEE